jgi:hypothetical protein
MIADWPTVGRWPSDVGRRPERKLPRRGGGQTADRQDLGSEVPRQAASGHLQSIHGCDRLGACITLTAVPSHPSLMCELLLQEPLNLVQITP